MLSFTNLPATSRRISLQFSSVFIPHQHLAHCILHSKLVTLALCIIPILAWGQREGRNSLLDPLNGIGVMVISSEK